MYMYMKIHNDYVHVVYMSVFSLVNYQGVGGGCGLEFTSKNLGHTHCHIKGIWMQKTWGPPTPKGPRENTACICRYIHVHADTQ